MLVSQDAIGIPFHDNRRLGAANPVPGSVKPV